MHSLAEEFELLTMCADEEDPDNELQSWLRMYGNGYSMAIVLDHRSTATSLTGNQQISS